MELKADAQEEIDEGRMLELEEEIYQVALQIQNLNDTLDSLGQTYKFHTDKINILTEEAIALNADNIEPLKFVGL